MKEKKKGRSVISNIVFVVALICCIVAAIQLIRIALSYREGTQAYDTITQQVVQESELAESEPKELSIDFDALKQINEDIIGWIRFDTIDIDYPILQGADNQEYLYTMADGTANNAGSIFMEALNTPDFNDPHTIIYGHNMKNNSMFGLLKNFIKEEGYFEGNRFFTIYTPDGNYRYEIFACYDVAEDDDIYQVGFIYGDVFQEFVDQMEQRSTVEGELDATGEDMILTLSTCSAEGRRTIINAARLEELDLEESEQ